MNGRSPSIGFILVIQLTTIDSAVQTTVSFIGCL